MLGGSGCTVLTNLWISCVFAIYRVQELKGLIYFFFSPPPLLFLREREREELARSQNPLFFLQAKRHSLSWFTPRSGLAQDPGWHAKSSSGWREIRAVVGCSIQCGGKSPECTLETLPLQCSVVTSLHIYDLPGTCKPALTLRGFLFSFALLLVPSIFSSIVIDFN